MSGRYIVVFKKNVDNERIDQVVNDVTENGGSVTHRYDSMRGFAATIPDQYLTTLKSLTSDIDYIEPDGEVTTQ